MSKLYRYIRWTRTYLSVRIDKTIAYSRIVLKMLNMQVTTYFSIAFNVLDDADGALDLDNKPEEHLCSM